MFKKYTLDNGIRVLTESMDHVRSVTLGVWVNVGARDETPQQSGISHFLEHMHFKGTQARSAKDIANAIDSVGGELNAFTSREGTTYYTKILDQQLDMGVDLLSDILLSSTFMEEEIEKEKNVIAEEIKMVEDTPDEYIHDLFNQTLWGKRGLGASVLGSPETVMSTDRSKLLKYVAGYYRPDNIVVAAAGRIDPDQLVERLNKTLGKIQKTDVPERELQQWGSEKLVVKTKDLAEVHVCLGVKGVACDDPDRYALYVLNTVFGSGMSSRLFQEIREKRGLTYSIYSFISSYQDTGLFAAYAGTSPQHVTEVIRLVINEMAMLRNGVDEETLLRTKEQLKGNLILGLESTSARMSQMARNEINFGRHFTLEDIISKINAVSETDVKKIAERLILEDNLVMTLLGPVSSADTLSGLMKF